MLAGDPALRAAVVEPARAVLADGRRVDIPSYTAWWLRRHARLDGRAPELVRRRGSTELAGLYDVVRLRPRPGVPRRRSGSGPRWEPCWPSRTDPDDLLDRLADPDRRVGPDQLRSLYVALAALDADRVSPPESVRVDPGTVVAADQVVVIDAPAHLQLPWSPAPIVVPLSSAVALADVLDVATSTATALGDHGRRAGRSSRCRPRSVGSLADCPDVVAASTTSSPSTVTTSTGG